MKTEKRGNVWVL